MEISEQNKRYLTVFSVLIVIVAIIFITGTQKKFSCDDWANTFKENFHCNIVLINKDFGPTTTLIGLDLNTKRIVNCEDGSKWIMDHFDTFRIGDTIIKKKGEYSILIKRRKNKIVIPFTCNDKVYRDK